MKIYMKMLFSKIFCLTFVALFSFQSIAASPKEILPSLREWFSEAKLDGAEKLSLTPTTSLSEKSDGHWQDGVEAAWQAWKKLSPLAPARLIEIRDNESGALWSTSGKTTDEESEPVLLEKWGPAAPKEDESRRFVSSGLSALITSGNMDLLFSFNVGAFFDNKKWDWVFGFSFPIRNRSFSITPNFSIRRHFGITDWLDLGIGPVLGYAYTLDFNEDTLSTKSDFAYGGILTLSFLLNASTAFDTSLNYGRYGGSANVGLTRFF